MKKNSTKLVALYLPQFYETEYNNEWWGKGYTEWVACKKAKPLYSGHEQPKVPLNKNFYDLSVKENIKWQMKLAKENGIDGFAIYQYYSCGKKLLEIPTEIIRDNKDLDLPFFLFWANESWRKAWFGQENTIIWEQRYGDEHDWRVQFEYCLPFFKDDRYMQIDGKPVYAIYNAWHFKRVEEFIDLWNVWAKEEGLDGIYFIKALASRDKKELGAFSASVTREPVYSFAFDEKFVEKTVRVVRKRIVTWINRKWLIPKGKGIVMMKVSYDKVWRRILNRKDITSNTILGAFPNWDNSPRRNYNSIIMQGASPEKFKKYMKELYNIAQENNCPMIVINAWNEWAEGAYLEPDEKNGLSYLNAIRSLKETVEE